MSKSSEVTENRKPPDIGRMYKNLCAFALLMLEKYQIRQNPSNFKRNMFEASCSSAKLIVNFLSCLVTSTNQADTGIKRQQIATIYVTDSNVTFRVQGLVKQSQASVVINRESFTKLKCEDLDDGLCLNLTIFLECLNVLGASNLASTRVEMSYDDAEAVFTLELEENGVQSLCAIPGSIAGDDEGNDFLVDAFNNGTVVTKAIVKSFFLRDAISELASINGATSCTIKITNDRLEISAVGSCDECIVDLPR